MWFQSKIYQTWCILKNLTSVHVFATYQSISSKWIFVNMIGEKWYLSVFSFLL